MNELPFFAIHLRKPMESISKEITDDESQLAEDTLSVFGVEWNVNSQFPDGSRSILGTMDIDIDPIVEALRKQLLGVMVTAENQKTFAHEREEDRNEEEGRMES